MRNNMFKYTCLADILIERVSSF